MEKCKKTCIFPFFILILQNNYIKTTKIMRVIIEKDYDKMSKWAADYVAKRIVEAKPTAEKPFKLGCPTGSSPLGLYKVLIKSQW